MIFALTCGFDFLSRLLTIRFVSGERRDTEIDLALSLFRVTMKKAGPRLIGFIDPEACRKSVSARSILRRMMASSRTKRAAHPTRGGQPSRRPA